MNSRFSRTLAYLLLALVCYAAATMVGAKVAMALFFVAGGILELMFWRELIWPQRKSSE